MPAYAPPPWSLRGFALHSVCLVPVGRARDFVPPQFRIVCPLPGRTLGGIFAGRYGTGSTLEYSELIVVPAVVRRRSRIGIWVSHIYVDSEASLHGGREIWGLPKEIADFAWGSGELAVSQNGVDLLRVDFGSLFGGAPIRLPIPVFAIHSGELVRFTGHVRSRVRPVPVYWRVQDVSPFAALGLGGTRFSLAHRELHAVIPAPERV